MSSNKQRSWVALTLAAILSGSLVVYNWNQAPKHATISTPSPRANTIPEDTLLQLKASARETAQQRLSFLPMPTASDELEGVPRESLQIMISSYRAMLAAQGLYNQHDTREKLIEQILQTPHGIEIASRALTDPQFAKRAFGELQAEARFFSVQVLRSVAFAGNTQHLSAAAMSIAQSLSNSRSMAQAIDAGRSADLRELVHAYIDLEGTESLAGGDAKIVQAIGYSAELSNDVKQIYDEAIFVRLNHEFGREKAAAITASLLDG